jgi:hypothetical protein
VFIVVFALFNGRYYGAILHVHMKFWVNLEKKVTEMKKWRKTHSHLFRSLDGIKNV